MADRLRRLVWAPRAKRDLADTWLYYVRIASLDVANELLREIVRVSAGLRNHPFMGRPRDELVSGLRSVLVHPHIVFYRVSDKSVEVGRVLHQRRDLAAALAPERNDKAP